MRGYQAIGRYKSRDPFGPWIGTIATNYCIDVLRQRKRLQDLFSGASLEEEKLAGPTDNGVGPLISAYEASTITRAVGSPAGPIPTAHRAGLLRRCELRGNRQHAGNYRQSRRCAAAPR